MTKKEKHRLLRLAQQRRFTAKRKALGWVRTSFLLPKEISDAVVALKNQLMDARRKEKSYM